MAAEIAFVQVASLAFFEICRERRESARDFTLGNPWVKKVEAPVQYRVAVLVGVDNILGNIPGAGQDRAESGHRQASSGYSGGVEDEIAVVPCGQAALDAE